MQQHILPTVKTIPYHLILSASHFLTGQTGRFVTANATHPPIKHKPPRGVTGPRNFHFAGSKVKRYMLPLNMVIPAVKRDVARVFWGAATLARTMAAE